MVTPLADSGFPCEEWLQKSLWRLIAVYQNWLFILSLFVCFCTFKVNVHIVQYIFSYCNYGTNLQSQQTAYRNMASLFADRIVVLFSTFVFL